MLSNSVAKRVPIMTENHRNKGLANAAAKQNIDKHWRLALELTKRYSNNTKRYQNYVALLQEYPWKNRTQ